MSESIYQLERSVIGAVLLNADTLALLPSLETSDFTSLNARTAWDAIRNLESRRQPIDVSTIGEEATRLHARKLDDNEMDSLPEFTAALFAYLGECALRVPTAGNAIEYARLLKDNALRNKLVTELTEIVGSARAGQATGAETLSAVARCASKLDAEQPEDARTIAVVTQKRLKELERLDEERRNGGAGLTGMPTGIAKLDVKLGGWQLGIVSIVAARPAMGKSSLVLATADVCSSQSIGVHVFSLEDAEGPYADRSLSRTSSVPAEAIRSLNLKNGQFGALKDALRKLGQRSYWLFDDRSGVTADEVVRSVRRRKRDNKTKVVIVDYIQLLKKPHPRMSSHEAIGENITTLADAAKQDSMAYVVLSQLSRETERRDDKRPQLADLRESGSLEERAKCVVGLYRGSVYGAPMRGIDYDCECPPKAQNHFCKPPSEAEFESRVELHILKNSNGQTGKVTATWHGPTTRME